MNVYHFQDYTIQVYNESSYTHGSADNVVSYHTVHFSNDAQSAPTSQHGVRIYKGESEIDNCIVIGYGGATTVSSTSALIDKEKLLICCSDSVFCLGLPGLDLLWTIQADLITCFQIFKIENNYIVHGELCVSSLDKAGRINWQFGGADIFLSNDGSNEFKIDRDGIIVKDFGGTMYKIGFDGLLISVVKQVKLSHFASFVRKFVW